MAEPYCEGYFVFLWLFELGSSKQSVPCSGTEGWSIILNAWGQILQCNSIAQRVAKPRKLRCTAAQGRLTLIPNFSTGKNVENRAKCQCSDAQCFTRMHFQTPGSFSMGSAESSHLLSGSFWGAYPSPACWYLCKPWCVTKQCIYFSWNHLEDGVTTERNGLWTKSEVGSLIIMVARKQVAEICWDFLVND